jgi:hypothetical protein
LVLVVLLVVAHQTLEVVQEILQVYLAQDSQHYQHQVVVAAVQVQLPQLATQVIVVVQVAVAAKHPPLAAVLLAKVITVVMVQLVQTEVVVAVVALELLAALLQRHQLLHLLAQAVMDQPG